jgi:hypothetical protein
MSTFSILVFTKFPAIKIVNHVAALLVRFAMVGALIYILIR